VGKSPECGYYYNNILRAGRVADLGGFRYIDLDTPMLLADDPFTGGYEQRGGHMMFRVLKAGWVLREDSKTRVASDKLC